MRNELRFTHYVFTFSLHERHAFHFTIIADTQAIEINSRRQAGGVEGYGKLAGALVLIDERGDFAAGQIIKLERHVTDLWQSIFNLR